MAALPGLFALAVIAALVLSGRALLVNDISPQGGWTAWWRSRPKYRDFQGATRDLANGVQPTHRDRHGETRNCAGDAEKS